VTRTVDEEKVEFDSAIVRPWAKATSASQILWMTYSDVSYFLGISRSFAGPGC
jgi:hypothetical protein